MLSDARVARIYVAAKQAILNSAYSDEVLWQRTRISCEFDESTFLRETAWVILSSGMRETIVRSKFSFISDAFFSWDTAKQIAQNPSGCVKRALSHFNHRGKIEAIATSALIVNSKGFASVLAEIRANTICALQQFPYIGSVTSYHLAKNLGFPVAKADRHLVRLAKAAGYGDVQGLCSTISEYTGDPIGVVDIVLWRFSAMGGYLDGSSLGSVKFCD